MTLPPLVEVRAERARRSFLDFVTYTHHDYKVQWYHRVLADTLEKFADLTPGYERVMVLMPPRHGKSEQTSRKLPARILGKWPDAEVIACSYSADLAQRMNRDVQRTMDLPFYAKVYPGTRLPTDNVRTVAGKQLRNSDLFEVVGRRGAYRSAGVGGGITGMGMDFGIIDDPVKNREDADSQVKRDSTWDWYTSTFYTRLSKTGRILLTQTRWHDDDLAGRILKAAVDGGERWHVLRLPAIAEATPTHPADPRAPGEALWPDKYPVERLHAIRDTLGSYEFNALYQQTPVADGGNSFKREWFPVVEAGPAEADVVARCRGWDLAGSDGTGDWTAGVRLARTRGGLIFVEDVVHGQWSPRTVDEIMVSTARADGRRCAIREEQEPGSSGKSVVAAHALALVGYDYQGRPASGEKTTRWRPFAAQAEAGNVRVVAGPWVKKYLDEMTMVPSAQHDDQADASAVAFDQVALQPRRGGGTVMVGSV